MADDITPDTTSEPSRRQVLRRVSAGAALAWTAPMVTTLDRAYAAGSEPGGGTCPGARLSGGPDPTTTIGVDDDLSVFVNGNRVFVDDNNLAQETPPVALGDLRDGDRIRVVASNRAGSNDDPCGIEPLHLHCSDGSTQVLDEDGLLDQTCDSDEVFYDETFTVNV